MEFTGVIKGITRSFDEKELNITFVTSSDIIGEYVKFKDSEKLHVKVGKFKVGRSLNANAYFHVLVGKISEVLTISKAKSKNILICKYGQPQLLPDGDVMIYKTNAPAEFMLEQESVHCIPVKYLDDATFYKIYRGSHTYDTKEMSLLIDGTVADAKELGIETLPPDELDRMKRMWGV
jgi:hypothetical protein